MKFVIGLLVAAAVGLGLVWWYANRGEGGGSAATAEGPGAATAHTPADAAAASADLLKQAKAAAVEGNGAKARALYEQVVKQYPDTWAGREANLELGNLYLKAGMKREAADAFRKGLPNATEAQNPIILATIRQIEEDLAKAAGGVAPAPSPAPSPTPAPTPAPTPSPSPAEADTTYTVVKGDTLTAVARKCKVSIEQIKLANNRTDDRLSIGDVLKISRQMPTLTVSKKKLTLQLFFKGATVKEYPVCIGKEAELTPAGTYSVGVKQKNPDWYTGGKRIPYGDPENILGTRWMTLISADGVSRGYGIHGTTKPETVPGRASAGCVRMLNADVEQLFEWVPTGTKVTISEE